MRAAVAVEVLYFDGCPNWPETVALIEAMATELGVEAAVELVLVRDPESAVEHRFLGSPTVRVNGLDVEPGAETRTEFVLACRLYAAATGLRGLPDEHWIRDALVSAPR